MSSVAQSPARLFECLTRTGVDTVAEVGARNAKDEPTVRGSLRSVAPDGRPVSTSKRSPTSATVRAIGPRWSNDVLSGTTPSHEISPIVALSPTVPHAAEGMRIEPPVSVPSAPKHMPAASAAAAPPLEPPADRDGSSGLRTGPKADSSLVVPNANSWRLVLPMMIAPAARRWPTAGASARASAAGSADPAVVFVPATSIRSLTDTGMPWSGPRYPPDRISRSAVARLGQRLRIEVLDEGIDFGPGTDLLQARLDQRDRRDRARLHKRRNVGDLTKIRAHGS